jgi:hypothetical protein
MIQRGFSGPIQTLPKQQASHAWVLQEFRMGVGSRVIPQIISEHNMVEIECPLCTKTVDLGSDSTGTYECPYCHEDFEYESNIKNHLTIDNHSQFGYLMHGVKKVTKPYAGYYRLGVLRDYNEEEIEDYKGGILQELKESFFSQDPLVKVIFFVFLPIFFILAIPIFIMWIPCIIYYFLRIKIQRLIYELGGHPGKTLTEVDHLYIHPDGRVIVPINDLLPFRFNIEGKMRIETHFHNGKWCSVSILKGRKCYFSLGDLPRVILDLDRGDITLWSTSDREEIYQFLRRFDLKECERRTADPIGGDGGGGV